MVHKEVCFLYSVYPDKEALSADDNLLLLEAIKAAGSAYAPYSEFKVGVAIRTADKRIVLGSNQENGAFPVGQCAERVALYRLTHEYGRKPIESIAIIIENENHSMPATPCGSCRQMLIEYRQYQNTPIRLLLGSVRSNEVYEINDVRDLLPLAFDGSFLGQ